MCFVFLIPNINPFLNTTRGTLLNNQLLDYINVFILNDLRQFRS
jgi:hypothetical protein